jgi:hypothetical protein
MSPGEVEDLTDLDAAAALEKGQETADTDRAAVEAAFAALRSPLGRSGSVRCVSAGKSPPAFGSLLGGAPVTPTRVVDAVYNTLAWNSPFENRTPPSSRRT